jgi:hypothetical protein
MDDTQMRRAFARQSRGLAEEYFGVEESAEDHFAAYRAALNSQG